jgi:hypothetical protein
VRAIERLLAEEPILGELLTEVERELGPAIRQATEAQSLSRPSSRIGDDFWGVTFRPVVDKTFPLFMPAWDNMLIVPRTSPIGDEAWNLNKQIPSLEGLRLRRSTVSNKKAGA